MARQSKPWYWKERKAWYVTINGKRHCLGDDKKQAKDRFHELMADKPLVTSSDTVWAILDAFLGWTKVNRPASFGWYQDHLQHFKDGVPNRRAVDLAPLHVQQWLDTQTWGPSMKAGAVTAIKRAFNWSVKMRVLRASPIAGLEKPTAGRRDRVYSIDEYQSIMALAKGDAFRDLLSLAWTTGARPQELTRIEARHLNAETKCVVFPKEEAKGKRRGRVIYVTDEAFVILAKWAKVNPTGPIMRNSEGKPWTPFAVACRFARMKDKLGFKPCMYSIRHSYIHHGLTKGRIDPVTMATLAGHSDLTMIHRVYGHLLKDSAFMRDAARQALTSNTAKEPAVAAGSGKTEPGGTSQGTP